MEKLKPIVSIDIVYVSDWVKEIQKKPELRRIFRDEIIRCNKHDILLRNIKANLPELKKLLEKINGECFGEDHFYRYYHHSFKVYYTQETTKEIVDMLKKLSPHKGKWEFHRYFRDLLAKGCADREWVPADNKDWQNITAPFIETFCHARYFLEQAIKYGEKYEKAPRCLGFGWAALLHLYEIR